jgi:hypothetical protein
MPDFSDYVIYADESGDHNLERINPEYPVFVLTFCIFRKSDYIGTVVPMVQEFKFRWFGHDAVVLHEREIRQQKPPFKFLQIRSVQDRFMAELSAIVERTPMTIIASVIDKTAHCRRYTEPGNPYAIGLLFCMERAHRHLAQLGQSHAVTYCLFEKRGAQEDRDLELQFRRIAAGANYSGTRFGSLDIEMVDKKANSSGLQIADLTARPIGLKTIRPGQRNRAYEIIEPKIRRSPTGDIRGWGLKVFP